MTSTHIRRCPYCGSQKIFVDTRNGVIVCYDCGTILDDYIIDYTQPQKHTTISLTVEVRRRKNNDVNINALHMNNTRLLRMLQKVKISDKEIFELIEIEDLSLSEREALIKLLNNKCIRRIIKRIKDEKSKLAILEALLYYMHTSTMPYLSSYIKKYGKVKERNAIVNKIKKAITSCLNKYGNFD